MNKKVIKEYLKRVDDLNTRLVGKDKKTFGWLIYGYNQCAKLLNETEQQCKKLKEQLQNISNEFLKYDWKNATQEQVYNQLKSLYGSIFKEVSE